MTSTNTTTSAKKANFSLPPSFSLLDALPHPIGIRNESLDLVFLNEAAKTNKMLLDGLSNFYEDKHLQQIIRQQTSILFQEQNDKATQVFEVEVGGKYLKVHQVLEQLLSGKRVVIETLTDITDAKTNALALSLMSIKSAVSEESKYLDHFTKKLAKAFDLGMVAIAITDPGGEKNTTLSCWIGDNHKANFSYHLSGTPCGRLYELREELFIPSQVQALFPSVKLLKTHNFKTFFGLPLFNADNDIIGIVAIADTKAFRELPLLREVLKKLIPTLSLEVCSCVYIQKLEVKKAWRTQAINSYKDGVSVFDKDYKVRLFNKTYSERINTQFGINLKKGDPVLDMVARQLSKGINNSLTIKELNKRKDWLQLAFSGQHHTQYIRLITKGKTYNYALSYHPIYNYNNTSVKEVLLLSHDITKLINSNKELERIKKHYYSVFENTLTGSAVYDMINMKAIDCNQQFLDQFGFKNKEDANKYTLGQLSPEHQPNGNHSQTFITGLPERLQKDKQLQIDWVHLRLDGSEFYSETSFIPLDDEHPGLYFITIKDFSDQISNQRILEQKNRELEQYIESNMQLENLAYSACHDLKEPLRTIGTFTQIIQQKYEHLIDDKSKEYMGFIVNGVTRMNNFVDALFTYSRVKENQHNFEEFSLPQLLEFIQMDLNQTIQEKKAVIQVNNIPESITANRAKIKQLFQNLITNALKFQASDIAPKVQITGIETGSHWNFDISDNGIGISEEYFDQIFTLFRKLHSRDQYEGSGIGLALSKEIVEQHKGIIAVSSEKGNGTTFSFGIKKGLGK